MSYRSELSFECRMAMIAGESLVHVRKNMAWARDWRIQGKMEYTKACAASARRWNRSAVKFMRLAKNGI